MDFASPAAIAMQVAVLEQENHGSEIAPWVITACVYPPLPGYDETRFCLPARDPVFG
jgi:hypothetical protein